MVQTAVLSMLTLEQVEQRLVGHLEVKRPQVVAVKVEAMLGSCTCDDQQLPLITEMNFLSRKESGSSSGQASYEFSENLIKST